jgi:hypothetical protein
VGEGIDLPHVPPLEPSGKARRRRAVIGGIVWKQTIGVKGGSKYLDRKTKDPRDRIWSDCPIRGAPP